MTPKSASAMDSAALRLLLVEDCEDDAQLVLREIRKAGYEPVWERVFSRADLESALKSRPWDLIISDHVMPSFSSFMALEVLHRLDLDIPFLVVSGAVPEEVVTEAMRAGAHDFISKSSLLRLVPAIRRELQELANRRERKRVATRLAESEGRYACLFQENPAPMLLVESTTLMVVDANPAASTFLGYSNEVLERAAIAALSCMPSLEGWKRLQRMQVPEGIRFQDRLRMADGRMVDVEVNAVRIPHRGRALLLATLQDQTGLKEAEYTLNQMAVALEQVTDGIVSIDASGTVVYANQAFARMVGCNLAEAKGRRIQDLISVKAFREGIAQVEQGLTWDSRFPFSRGSERMELRATLSPIRGGSGTTGAVAVIRDITKGVERDRQLRQAEKMDALGTLAAGISHDFNNVLTTILSAAELIKAKLPEDSSILPKVDAILHAGLCASGLNRQILSFSRRTEERKIPVDLSATVRDAVQMLRSTLPAGTEIKGEIVSGLWVESDPAQLQQVVLNLGINAYRAFQGKRGRIEIILSEVQPHAVGLPHGLEDQRCAMLRVIDDGCGIEPSAVSRIFEPFFTTRPEGEGTGLGLAMVHATVTQSGGRIGVSSELGVGTVFTLHFPCAPTQARPADEDLPEDMSGSERILLVEDEELVAALAKQGLQSLGYRVTTMNHPLEALEEFRRKSDRYDLVLMDLAMPEMNGAELTGRMQELRPGLPVILVTGLPPATALTLNARATFRGVVAKPFTAYELAKAIRRALLATSSRKTLSVPAVGTVSGRSHGASILLAEDSLTTRAMIQSWLEQEGYRVHAAKDGMEAWEQFDRGQSFDLLLTDLVMPRMNGLELSQLMRNADPSIPIAVLTSSDDADAVKTALNLGVKEYLSKPFAREVLLSCVKRLLDERMSRLDARRSVETAQAVRLAQRSLVATPEKGLPLFSLYEPLTDAGGDIFRSLRCVDGSILFVLADVAGHSVASSYAVASFLTMLSTFSRDCGELRGWVRGEWTPRDERQCPMAKLGPCEPLRHLALRFNQSIQDGPFPEVPVCALLGHWNPTTGRLQLLNAGIPHPLMILGDADRVQPIALNGTPLGIFEEPMMEERVLQLLPGDRILLGTDGFFDVQAPDGKLFQDIVPEQWRALKTAPMDWALSVICEAARNFANGVIADDLMVVVFEQPALATSSFVKRVSSLPSSVDEVVAEFGAYLQELSNQFELQRERSFDLCLALREALINALSHGNKDREEALIACRAGINRAGELEVFVVDEGEGFRLCNHVAPDDPLSLRGRGLPLIKNSTKKVEMVVGELGMSFELKERVHGSR